jgi:folate-binding protein YgfZ
MDQQIYERILGGESLAYHLPQPALWKLSGPDALRYLNGQVTADVTKLAAEQGAYAAVCSAKGRMEGELFIARHGEDFYLDAVAILHESLGLRLEKYLIADDASFEDLSDSWSLVHFFGRTLPAAPTDGFVVGRDRFGLPGFDVWSPVPATNLSAEVSKDIVETIRLEQGVPVWDAELTPTTLPPEAGPRMLAALTYTKGCYVGQETISRLKSVGHVNRTLVFLQGSTPEFPAPTTVLTHEDRQVGVITSSGFSPRRKCGIALGYVQLQQAETGGKVLAGPLQLEIAEPLSAPA